MSGFEKYVAALEVKIHQLRGSDWFFVVFSVWCCLVENSEWCGFFSRECKIAFWENGDVPRSSSKCARMTRKMLKRSTFLTETITAESSKDETGPGKRKCRLQGGNSSSMGSSWVFEKFFPRAYPRKSLRENFFPGITFAKIFISLETCEKFVSKI